MLQFVKRLFRCAQFTHRPTRRCAIYKLRTCAELELSVNQMRILENTGRFTSTSGCMLTGGVMYKKQTNGRHVGILLPVSIFTCIITRMTFCIGLPNFIQIGPFAAALWRHTCFKMMAAVSQFYFRFRFSDFAQLGRSKSTDRPNFGEISQSTAEILLLPVSGNKRPPCARFATNMWSTRDFI